MILMVNAGNCRDKIPYMIIHGCYGDGTHIHHTFPAAKEDMALTKSDFEKMVLEPGIVRVMHESGVNVDVLAEMLDLVWEADLVTVTVQYPGPF